MFTSLKSRQVATTTKLRNQKVIVRWTFPIALLFLPENISILSVCLNRLQNQKNKPAPSRSIPFSHLLTTTELKKETLPACDT